MTKKSAAGHRWPAVLRDGSQAEFVGKDRRGREKTGGPIDPADPEDGFFVDAGARDGLRWSRRVG